MINKFPAYLCLATVLLTGCERSSTTDRDGTSSAGRMATADSARHEEPVQADLKFAEIKRRVPPAGRIAPDVVEALMRLHREAPNHGPTRNLLIAAFIQREDWNSLADLLREKPVAERTQTEQLELAKILIKAQHFAEGFELADGVVVETGPKTNPEAAWLAAYAAFNLGKLSKAAEILDANFEALTAAGRNDAYVIRALVYFRQGQLKEAESLLTTLLETNPSHAAGHDALGRVLVAAGDAQRGNEHMRRASELRDQVTRTEQRGLRLAAMSQSLSTAWARKDYDTCDRLITQMLEHASPEQRIRLYQNRAAIRAAQGRRQEAAEALEKARQLSSSEAQK